MFCTKQNGGGGGITKRACPENQHSKYRLLRLLKDKLIYIYVL